MPYYLGLDAGGTKTYCLIGDEHGTIRGFGRAGTGNYEYRGVEPAAEENRKAVEGALNEADLTLSDIAGIGMGIAGADIPEDYVMLENEIFTPLFGSIRRAFRNDSMAGLRGGTRSRVAIVIACGTGCVCAGRNANGDETRVGGLGEEFGDECSGGSIGREALKVVWRARDNVVPETLLTEKFVKRAGCRDVTELFYKMYRREIAYEDLEPMAKLVFEAALEGDTAACDILERGGRYLGRMVNGTARRIDMTQESFEVVMAGSVFKGESPVLVDAMRTEIHRVCPNAKTVMPEFEPVVGALLMAMELDVSLTPVIYERLSSELDRVEKIHSVRFRTE